MFEDFKEKFEIQKEDIIKNDINVFYIKRENIKNVLESLKNSPNKLFERLDCLFAKDNSHNFVLFYVLHSDKYNKKCAIAVELNYDDANIVSISNIFQNANWEEREIYDLFGIKFLNHPKLKRILLPNSFKGHPLKKDYIMDDERLEWNYD